MRINGSVEGAKFDFIIISGIHEQDIRILDQAFNLCLILTDDFGRVDPGNAEVTISSLVTMQTVESFSDEGGTASMLRIARLNE